MDLGKPCTKTEACTLPNIYCQHPICAYGNEQALQQKPKQPQTEAIAALQPGGDRKWPDTICNDIDKMLRQHIRWTQGDHSEGIYIEGWRKAARAVEEYINALLRTPVAVTVDDEMVERFTAAVCERLGFTWANISTSDIKRGLSAALAGEVR